MSPIISADMPEELKERVDAERREKESRSAVIKRLVRAQLNEKEPAPRIVRVGFALRGLSILLGVIWAASYLPPADVILYAGLSAFVVSIALRLYHDPESLTASVQDWLATVRGS